MLSFWDAMRAPVQTRSRLRHGMHLIPSDELVGDTCEEEEYICNTAVAGFNMIPARS